MYNFKTRTICYLRIYFFKGYHRTHQWDTCVYQCQCQSRPRCQTSHSWCCREFPLWSSHAGPQQTPFCLSQGAVKVAARGCCRPSPTEWSAPIQSEQLLFLLRNSFHSWSFCGEKNLKHAVCQSSKTNKIQTYKRLNKWKKQQQQNALILIRWYKTCTNVQWKYPFQTKYI